MPRIRSGARDDGETRRLTVELRQARRQLEAEQASHRLLEERVLRLQKNAQGQLAKVVAVLDTLCQTVHDPRAAQLLEEIKVDLYAVHNLVEPDWPTEDATLLDRYHHLVEQKYLRSLDAQERDEMERLAHELDARTAAFYDPIIENLRTTLEELKSKAGA